MKAYTNAIGNQINKTANKVDLNIIHIGKDSGSSGCLSNKSVVVGRYPTIKLDTRN